MMELGSFGEAGLGGLERPGLPNPTRRHMVIIGKKVGATARRCEIIHINDKSATPGLNWDKRVPKTDVRNPSGPAGSGSRSV